MSYSDGMDLWRKLVKLSKHIFGHGNKKSSALAEIEWAPNPNDFDFTAAIIGLGAKLAKADGQVTDPEIATFSQVFQTDPKDAAAVRRVFSLAQQSVHGYEAYAKQIGRKYRARPGLLEGVLDGLFMIAMADGVVTDDELSYLKTVASAFGFNDIAFERIVASHLGSEVGDPYQILGVAQDASFNEVRFAYRRLIADHHPDRFVARGVPLEFISVAHEKAAAITGAYARIRAERGPITAHH